MREVYKIDCDLVQSILRCLEFRHFKKEIMIIRYFLRNLPIDL